jgi:hypothetical protein
MLIVDAAQRFVNFGKIQLLVCGSVSSKVMMP